MKYSACFILVLSLQFPAYSYSVLTMKPLLIHLGRTVFSRFFCSAFLGPLR
jgi:hypothetical protein